MHRDLKFTLIKTFVIPLTHSMKGFRLGWKVCRIPFNYFGKFHKLSCLNALQTLLYHYQCSACFTCEGLSAFIPPHISSLRRILDFFFVCFLLSFSSFSPSYLCSITDAENVNHCLNHCSLRPLEIYAFGWQICFSHMRQIWCGRNYSKEQKTERYKIQSDFPHPAGIRNWQEWIRLGVSILAVGILGWNLVLNVCIRHHYHCQFMMGNTGGAVPRYRSEYFVIKNLQNFWGHYFRQIFPLFRSNYNMLSHKCVGDLWMLPGSLEQLLESGPPAEPEPCCVTAAGLSLGWRVI